MTRGRCWHPRLPGSRSASRGRRVRRLVRPVFHSLVCSHLSSAESPRFSRLGYFPCRRSLPDSRRWRGESAAASVCFEGDGSAWKPGTCRGGAGRRKTKSCRAMSARYNRCEKRGTEAFLLPGAAGPRSSRRPPLGRLRLSFWTRPRRPAIAPTPGGSSSLQTAAGLNATDRRRLRTIEPQPKAGNQS